MGVKVCITSGGSFTSYKIDETSGEIKGLVYNEFYGLGSNVVPDRQVT